jgi:putative transposase
VALLLIGSLPAPRLCIADTAYDSDGLRQFLLERGTRPVIPNNPTRRRVHPFDRDLYRARNQVERTICRLKDFRRIATRYDRLAQNYLAAVHIAASIAFWL